jgi:hypothetical protein
MTAKPTTSHRPQASRTRRGQALVEFAIVALVMYVLLAATIEFARAFFGAQTIQSAADLAARELSRAPLSATYKFADALQDPIVKQSVYSEDFLAVDVSGWVGSGTSLVTYLQGLPQPMPPVNLSLMPLMLVDTVGGKSLLRYPGALVTSPTAPSGYTVKVPIVTSRAGSALGTGAGYDGTETIEWHDVLEQIGANSSTSTTTPYEVFSVAGTAGSTLPTGLAAVRINYPFQAATMSAFKQTQTATTGNILSQYTADDGGVSATNSLPDGMSPVAPDSAASGTVNSSNTYGGQYGLGAQQAAGLSVRPYRQVLSAQAIYRREIFSGP